MLFGAQADAAYVITFEQEGANVVASGSGSFDLTDLQITSVSSPFNAAVALPAFALLEMGGGSYWTATGFSGPTSFGSGYYFSTPDTTGSATGLYVTIDELFLPQNYVSGTTISATATFENEMLASMGLTAGSSYEWTWGTGDHADSLTIEIAASPVPEPSTWALALAGFGGLGMAAFRRARKATALAV
jgi:hypothetical protein